MMIVATEILSVINRTISLAGISPPLLLCLVHTAYQATATAHIQGSELDAPRVSFVYAHLRVHIDTLAWVSDML